MSRVYLATHIRLRRQVAIKVLLPQLAADPDTVRRFESEAILSAGLSHPNIVRVTDQGVDGPDAYLVMEYVRGMTLRDLLRERGRMTPRQALTVLNDISAGLAAAHERGIVHRDMKPANVLLSDTGDIKVADFGLARATTQQTSASNLMGTAAYISPELVEGKPSDERSDVYAVGIIAYELLTGHQPFTGESQFQIALQHVGSEVPAPSRLIPGLHSDLDELVRCCTEKDPENRPQDAQALLGEVRHILSTMDPGDLDFDSELLGTLSDLVPAAPPEPVIHVDAEAGDKTLSMADGHTAGTTVLGPPPPLPPGLAAIDTDATTPLTAGRDRTEVFPGFRPQSSDDTGRITEDTELEVHDELAALPSKREQRAADKRWKKDAQIPTETLAPRMSTRRRWILGTVLALLAVLITASSLFFGFGPGARVQLPQLGGKSATVAIEQLTALGIKSHTQKVFDERFKTGLVVSTDPVAGSVIRRYEPVQVIVSQGPELFSVPNLGGTESADAPKALGAVNLAPGTSTGKYSEKVAKGLIISTDPAAGADLRRASVVDLVVSKGPAPVKVPELRGITEEQAMAALKKAGLKGKSGTPANDGTVAAGLVLSQTPSAGKVERGSIVEYVLSLGPKMIEVPNFQGKQLDEAKAELERLGFTVEVEKLLGGFFGTVRSQDPASGTAPEKSIIRLVVV
ncbi:Stk1 family PASTA domain-containing Ser/Thr kinase [Paeniglutamicibacter cryotolerans]|uniref:non-specific serine/threonine protein kinase n=2 Tax=Paeniglutamicibacter cryotolerans TaxID=670079 RepID=A0A839QKF8_9MICC|nr:serine/threonine-protein kinase [Paeniglutamicibacter cryotolerans]